MPFNLLIFPLAGGYYLFVRLHYLKYIQHRSDRQRLLFNSIIGGIALLIVTYFFRIIVESIMPNQIRLIWQWLPIKEPYFGTSIFTFIFAFCFAELVNLFTNRTRAITRAITQVGNELELILMGSFSDSEMLQITLSNDKFYIGWVTELPLPSKSSYIKILPAFSGFRDEKKELVFTTEYLGVYASYVEEGRIRDVSELRSDIVIKLDEIITANIFSIEMYERFNKPPETPEANKKKK